MKNVVRIIGVTFVTLVILGAPVLLFLSLMLKWPVYIAGLMAIIVGVDAILVGTVVEALYEEDYDG